MQEGIKKPSMDNESGLAYGFMMILLYFGAAIAIWFGWTAIVDIILTVSVNPAINVGDVSAQTATVTGFVVNIIRYAPPILLLFGFIYVVNRGIYTRNNQ